MRRDSISERTRTEITMIGIWPAKHPHGARNEKERTEGHPRRQDGEDRPAWRSCRCTAYRRDDPRASALALRMDVLAHEDRVIHHDPDGEDEGEERHHVDGEAEHRP